MAVEPGRRPKWFNAPVCFFAGTIGDIGEHVPDFERRQFALAGAAGGRTGVNPRLETVVRKPFGKDSEAVPIGVVSKDYVLVKHADVIKTAGDALRARGIEPGEVKAELRITEYGERMALSLYLPDKYAFDPGDGNKLAMRLECFNSVEGSTRFRAMMGWFRFVCSNGLVVGVTQSDIRRRHVGDLSLGDVASVLASGLKQAEAEKENFRRWRQRVVPMGAFVAWVEKELRRQWGFKAAARAYHIARTGCDAEIVGQFKGRTPTNIETRALGAVPGAGPGCRNLFDVSQVLAWLAKERRDLQEQLEWREQIPAILEPLMN